MLIGISIEMIELFLVDRFDQLEWYRVSPISLASKGDMGLLFFYKEEAAYEGTTR